MSFHHAVLHVIEREGGLVDDPRDPGGITKYGISHRAYPSLTRREIVEMTIPQAQEIYKRDYWDKIRGDEFDGTHDAVGFVLFDCAVNQGVSKAIKLAQTVVGVTQDGVLGPKTMAAIKSMSPSAFVEQFMAERILHYAKIPTWNTFGRGWMRRVIGTAMESVK